MMYVYICQAKKVVIYLAHAKPDRLVDELMSELRVSIGNWQLIENFLLQYIVCLVSIGVFFQV